MGCNYSHNSKNTKVFNDEIFNELVERTGMSRREIAAASGISLASLVAWSKGLADPRLDTIVQLADYFAVPIDFLLGRTDEETANAILENYAECYQQLRRKDYEATLRTKAGIRLAEGSQRSRHANNCEAPYPYNLLDNLVCGNKFGTIEYEDMWQDVITPDQEAALKYVLSTFSDREQLAVNLYYKQDKTLEETSKELGITRERVRQILARTVRRMRHPTKMNLILYGLEGYEHLYANRNRRAMLEKEDMELDEMEQELLNRRVMLENALAVEQIERGERKKQKRITDITVEEMDFSVRTYNCLLRANIRTLNDIIQKASTEGYDGFLKVRNLGRKSVEEVYMKLEAYTGAGYEHYESLHMAYAEKRM